MRYQCSTRIQKPIDEVFSIYTDYRYLSAWLPNVISLELISDVFNVVGSKAHLKIKHRNQIMTIMVTILEMSPPYRSRMRFETDGLQYINDTVFEDLNGATLWRQEVHYLASGLSLWLAKGNLEGFKTCTQKKMEAFKAYCEATAPDLLLMAENTSKSNWLRLK